MEAKLYVGNLAYAATDDDLQTFFAQAGTVKSVTVVKDRNTGRARGFAFVEMATEEEAQKAISMLNGSTFLERAITVNLARPREDRGDDGGKFDRRRDDRPRGGGYDRNR